MFPNQIRTTLTEAAVMGQKLVSHVPELLNRLGMDSKTFKAKCMLAGMSEDTARRLINGETQITPKNLAIAASVLGVSSISEIVDVEQ
jgi:VIT1/CCC1 family predicted Fe2+/Mn2+ transporter